MLHGVIFDLDGTLVHQHLDFEVIRREIGLPSQTPLLEALDGMSLPHMTSAFSVIERHEQAAAETAEALPGVGQFLARLDERGLRRAVLTRNSRASALAVLARCALTGFDPVVSRDDARFKPHPDGIWKICAAWGVPPESVLMVGDYRYDIEAGQAAGSRTALITHGRDLPFAADADLVLASFEDIPPSFWESCGIPAD